MKKFSVAYQVYASAFITVEAENEEEARRLAEAEISEPRLCHHCSDHVQIDAAGEIVSVDEVTND